jgi:hypothetical protein
MKDDTLFQRSAGPITGSPDASAGSPESTTRPGWRWYQFTLRAVLALVLVSAFGLAGWRMYLAPYQAQADAIDLITQLGGTYQADAGPAWMNLLAGFELHNVTLVNLADCDTPEKYVDHIARLPALETLVVGGQSFVDEHLSRLGNLKMLNWLVLDSTETTDRGVETLKSRLPRLTVYVSQRRAIAAIHRVRDCYVRKYLDKGVIRLQRLIGQGFFYVAENVWGDIDERRSSFLRKLTTVKDVRFSQTSSGVDAALGCAAGMTNLERLELAGAGLSDVGLRHLRALRRLKTLALTGKGITDDGVIEISALGGLEALYLEATSITDSGLERLKPLSKLKHLALVNASITDRGLAGLRELSGLSSLAIEDTGITDAGLRHILLLENLESLSLDNTEVSGARLGHLMALRKLVGLSLSGEMITDAALAHVGKLSGLTWVSLDSERITDVGLAHLARLSNLERLLLDAPVSGNGAGHMKALRNLKRLQVFSVKLTDADEQEMRKALPECTILFNAVE